MSQSITSTNQARRTLCAFAVVVLFALTGTHARSDTNIEFVRSTDAAPYQAAEKVIRSHLRFDADSTTLESFVKRGTFRSRLHVAIGTRAALWLSQNLPADFPLVYCMVSDAEQLGLDNRPKTVGVGIEIPLAVQVEIIQAAMPEARSIGLLYRTDHARSKEVYETLQRVVPVNWKVIGIPVDQKQGFLAAQDALIASRPDIIWTWADPSIYRTATIRSLLRAAFRSRTPVFGFSTSVVKAGSCLGVGFDLMKHGSQTAELIQRVSDGGAGNDDQTFAPVKPRFQIIANQIVAEKLRVRFPREFLDSASEVIRSGDSR